MNTEKYEYPVPCPLMKNQLIDANTCFDIHVVVDGSTPKDFAPKEIYEVANYENVCFHCPYHRFN